MTSRCFHAVSLLFAKQPNVQRLALCKSIPLAASARAPAALFMKARTISSSNPPTELLTPHQDDHHKEIRHDMVHFKASSNKHPLNVEKLHDKHGDDYKLHNVPHPIWSREELEVKETHMPFTSVSDRIAFYTVKMLRWSFDTFSGYRFGVLTEGKVLNRAIFLETVAGVPGMTAGMLRHLRSLRRMDRDHGWIHTLLEEAENERMHLLTFIKLKKPGFLFRSSVIGAQAIFMPIFFIAYMIHPHICHRFVGYLEEEAVHTYASILDAIDDGRLGAWKTQAAPAIAIDYWQLGEKATMKDLILAVRADEANHRDVNHTFATMKLDDETPFAEDGRILHPPPMSK